MLVVIRFDSAQAMQEYTKRSYDQPRGLLVKSFDILACNFPINIVKISRSHNHIASFVSTVFF